MLQLGPPDVTLGLAFFTGNFVFFVSFQKNRKRLEHSSDCRQDRQNYQCHFDRKPRPRRCGEVSKRRLRDRDKANDPETEEIPRLYLTLGKVESALCTLRSNFGLYPSATTWVYNSCASFQFLALSHQSRSVLPFRDMVCSVPHPRRWGFWHLQHWRRTRRDDLLVIPIARL